MTDCSASKHATTVSNFLFIYSSQFHMKLYMVVAQRLYLPIEDLGSLEKGMDSRLLQTKHKERLYLVADTQEV